MESESKWRQNVAEVGWANGPFKMFARLLSDQRFLISTPLPTTVLIPVWFLPVDGGPVAEIVALTTKLQPNFPYGYNVETDRT